MNNLFWAFVWRTKTLRSFPNHSNIYRRLLAESNLSRDEWEKTRNKNLSTLLPHACQYVPYYRTIFQKTGIPINSLSEDNLSNFPLLTKDIIKDNLETLISEKSNKNTLIENATGGSTGVPLKFYQDHHYLTVANALDAYVRKWWGVKPYDKTASIWGADREFHELSFKEKLSSKLDRVIALNAFRMNKESLREFCITLKKWQPPYLMGYSSALEAMAECAIENGIELRFKAIRSTAETLWPHQRSLFEEAFKSPVYNFYGSREVNNIAAECPSMKFHLISTMRFIEIVDEMGNRLPDGEEGFIAVTDLSNFSMPFIRYLNGDYGKLSNVPCDCGLPSPYIDKLLGRSTDLIRTKTGDMIHGEFFTHLFYGVNSIKQFQVHQKSLSEIKIRLVPEGDGPDELFVTNLKQKICDRLGSCVNISVEICKEIPIPKSGKHRFTISDV